MPAPKTPKIRVYRPHWGVLPPAAQIALQGPTHVSQGNIYVAAPRLVDALVHAGPARLSTGKGEYRVAHGSHLDAMLAAGLLAVDGEIVVTPSSTHVGSPIVRRDPATGLWSVIGHFTGSDPRTGRVDGVALTTTTDQD